MSMLDSLFGRSAVATWEGVTFRERDRVVSKNSGETTLKPEETGHRSEVLLGDGKTGQIVKRSNENKVWIYVQWDAQKWQEAGKRRTGAEVGDLVELPPFRSCLHVDYVRLDSLSPARYGLPPIS